MLIHSVHDPNLMEVPERTEPDLSKQTNIEIWIVIYFDVTGNEPVTKAFFNSSAAEEYFLRCRQIHPKCYKQLAQICSSC